MKSPATKRKPKDGVSFKKLPAKHSQRRKGYLWMVESRLNGKRARKFFRHDEAEKRDKHVENINESIDKLAKKDRPVITDHKLLEEASRAAKRLADYGKTISEAADFYLEYLGTEAERDSTPVSTVVKRFLSEKQREGVSTRHYQDLKNRLARFEKEYGETPIASLDRNAISEWTLALELAPQSKVNFRRVLSNLFAYAVKTGIIPVNPVRDAATVKVRRKKAEILTDEEVKKLVESCPDSVLPAIVLMVFCGIRNNEVFRLEWQEIDWEDNTIEISAEKAKRESHARHVSIPNNAAEWLRPLAKTRGPIANFKKFHTFTKALQEARTAAGWKPGKWPDNALRKTFISCHYESFGSIDETAKQAGTSVAVIHRYYRRLIKKAKAEKLWEIIPKE
jgi:integrase